MDKKEAMDMCSKEIQEIKSISKNTDTLQKFWERRYVETYNHLLDSEEEIGRHGIIVEYLSNIVQSGNILDVGCGTGILPNIMNTDKFNYTGIDISKTAILKASNKSTFKKNIFVNIRFEEFSSKTKYKAIILNESIYYMDIDIVIKKIRELIENDGFLIISAFDFKEGSFSLESVKTIINNPLNIILNNKNTDFKWNFIAGKLNKF